MRANGFFKTGDGQWLHVINPYTPPVSLNYYAALYPSAYWSWKDKDHTPQKVIHHDPGQGMMGPTGDGWDEVVKDVSKIGDPRYGNVEFDLSNLN